MTHKVRELDVLLINPAKSIYKSHDSIYSEIEGWRQMGAYVCGEGGGGVCLRVCRFVLAKKEGPVSTYEDGMYICTCVHGCDYVYIHIYINTYK